VIIDERNCVCEECGGRLEIYDADHETLSVICTDPGCEQEFTLEHSEVRNGKRLAQSFLLYMQDSILADC
jgi:hypothetical protein